MSEGDFEVWPVPPYVRPAVGLYQLKESAFSTVEAQRERAGCGTKGHQWWEHGPALIFNYMVVMATCHKCGTRRA